MYLKGLIAWLEQILEDCRCVDTDSRLEIMINELSANGLEDIDELESTIDDINLGGSL